MGFGSYDESEQDKQEIDADEDSENHRMINGEHDGEVSFTGGDSPDNLIDQLQEIKDDTDEE